jgi:YVTN family beta-propeller protein
MNDHARNRDPRDAERLDQLIDAFNAGHAPEAAGDPTIDELLDSVRALRRLREPDPQPADDPPQLAARLADARAAAAPQPRANHASRERAPEQPRRAWSSPALRRPTRAQATSAPPSLNAPQEARMSTITNTPNDPIPLAQRRWAREAAKIAAAAIVFGVIGAILALVLRGGDESSQPGVAPVTPSVTSTAITRASPATAQPTAANTPTAQPSVASAAPLTGHSTTIPVGAGPLGLAAGAGAVWVPNIGDGTLSRIDPTTNTVVATIDVGANPADFQTVASMPIAVAASDTAVWVTRYNGSDATHLVRDLLRIDPATNAIVATIPLDVTPHFIALGDGALWILSSEHNAVLRVDTATNQVVATIPVAHPLALAVGEGAVWVSSGPSTSTSGPVTRTVVKIDSASNTVVGTIDVDQNTLYLTAGAGAVWLADVTTNEVLRIDPATYAVTARIHVVLAALLAVDDGVLWAQSGQLRTLSRIDLASNTVVATYPSAGLGGPIVVADGAVWVTDSTVGTVIRIDP